MFKKYTPHLLLLFILIISFLIIYIVFYTELINITIKSEKNNTNNANNANNANTTNIRCIPETEKICLTIEEYNKLLSVKEKNNVEQNNVEIRDRKVVEDQLYPPINRADNKTHSDLIKNINERTMYIKTNDINDTYRLVAYVTNNSEEKDAGNNNWKLFARQKDRNISEFYMKPTDNNNDMKVPITDSIVVGERLRDIYNIPKQLTLNSPLFNANPYNVVEIPKADLTNSSDYI